MMEKQQDLLVARELLKLFTADEILKTLSRKGIKKSLLAKELGKSRSRISQILNGEANLTLSTLSDIAKVLGCDVEVKFHDKSKKFVTLDESLVMTPRPDLYSLILDVFPRDEQDQCLAG